MRTVVDGGLRSDDDIMLDKRGWSSFAGTNLDRTLRDHGVTQVVVVGLATTSGVESTARQAYLGFHVLVVRDAINNPDAQEHEHSGTRVFSTLGQVCTTDELMRLLPGAP